MNDVDDDATYKYSIYQIYSRTSMDTNHQSKLDLSYISSSATRSNLAYSSYTYTCINNSIETLGSKTSEISV